MYALVVIDKPVLGLSQRFTYKVPEALEDMLKPGHLVKIPFGARQEIGFVEALSDIPQDGFDVAKMKEIDSLASGAPLLSEHDFELARWISDAYLASYSESIKLVLPPGGTSKLKHIISVNAEEGWPESSESIKAIFENSGSGILETELKHLFATKDLKQIHELIKKGLLSEEYILAGPRAEPKTRIAAELISQEKPPEKTPAQLRVWELLKLRQTPILVSELIKLAETNRATVLAMEKRGYLALVQQEMERIPGDQYLTGFDGKEDIELTVEQNSAIDIVIEAISAGLHSEFLLQGVTGSGKTEVYLEISEVALSNEGSIIILVPEISLTPQTVTQFRNRFPGLVAVLHSNLSLGERFDQWQGVKEGRYRIIIGPRSAVFAPAQNLKAIIVDEEHEASYKQATEPRYDAKEAARKKAQLCGAVLVLGSATPMLETRYRAKLGQIKRLIMPWRPMRPRDAQFPEAEVVDLRSPGAVELGKSIGSVLSEGLEECFTRERKALLFLNRRGFARFLICNSCGHVEMCDNCNVSMTYHRSSASIGAMLKCHHCNATRMPPEICPACGLAHMGRGGVAIQQVEAELRFRWPKAKIIRMDADAVTAKGAHARLLNEFGRSKSAVLLGTQMIAKGLDFPDIDLVGIIDADVAINLPDFRSSERTFQMLLQVSGRAGRGDRQGRVIIQTYNPQHPAIRFALAGAYEEFFEYELSQREELSYPPFSRLANIIVSGEDEMSAQRAIDDIADIIKASFADRTADILGPAPAPISKLKNKFRFHVFLKLYDFEIGLGHLRDIHDNIKRAAAKRYATVIIDIDPYWLL